MPYRMVKQGNKFCVMNKTTGENKGCSDTRGEAMAHMRAMYAVEGGAKMGKKELNDLVFKAVEEFNAENPDDLITKEEVEAIKGYAPMGVYTFADLRSYRDSQNMMEEAIDLAGDFTSMVWNIMYASDVEDKGASVKALADEFATLMGEEVDQSDTSNKAISARSDVSAADKKRAVGEYGDVTYADEKNKKYPLDTEKHIRAAWAYISMPKNQKKYSSAEVASIKRKIIAAWKSKIDKAGPPKAAAKELVDNFTYMLKEFLGMDTEEEDEQEYEVLFGDDSHAEEKESETQDDSDLMVWKEADTGQYRWFGRYSNNFRDSDRPPEIISEASHKHFVEQVEKGLAPMPELRLWHIKEWKIGQADWLAYDDSGFALASGKFDKGLDDVAEWLMETNDVLMSHGMPPSSIVYDKSDPSIIIEHETKEISVLPRFAAANKLTGFAVLGKEEDSMAIPKEKKELLIKKWNADPALLDRLEAMNAKVASVAKEAGLESKEQTPTEVQKEEVVAQQAATETATTEPTTTSTPADYPTRQEIADAVATILGPMADKLDTLERALDGVLGEVKELKSSKEEQVKQVLESTPAASLGALIAQRVIGSKEASVDERTVLAKSKPKEATEAKIGIPFLDNMLQGK